MINNHLPKDIEASALQREYKALKTSEGNFRCRNCLMVDGYKETETKCHFCGADIFERDKL